MLVRMKTKIGGYRDGLEWPDAGDTIDVPDHEATSLILNRYAEAMEAPDAVQDSQPHADSDDQPDRGQADDPAADSDGQPDDNSNGGADEPTEAVTEPPVAKAPKKPKG